jgi:caffeoyl-CoA O-methyltransferase
VTPVSILAASLHDIVARLEADDHCTPAVMDALRNAAELAGGLDAYVAECTTPESPQLRALAQRTAAHDWGARQAAGGAPALEQEMLSGHVEGQLLNFLVRATRSRRVLEVGMFTGYSALAMAEALPAGGTVVACEIDARAADFARACFGDSPHGGKIAVEVGPAMETLHRLSAEGLAFDLIFIDADKAGYGGYFRQILDGGLMAPHGVICVDNTLLQGDPYMSGPSSPSGEAIRAFNQMVADDPRVEQVLLPVRDGLTLVRLVGAD